MKIPLLATCIYFGVFNLVGGVVPKDKVAELGQPIKVEVVSQESPEKGNEIIVNITNPNFYAVSFYGRGSWDSKTIKQRSKSFEGGAWKDAGFDWCGTGVKEWVISPNGSMEVRLFLNTKLKKQQIIGRFYAQVDPRIQSDCVLYETK